MVALKTTEDGLLMRHNMPLDKKNGIKNENGIICTEEELISKGWYLFETLPLPEQIEGKESILKLDESGNVYYEYRDRLIPEPSEGEKEIVEIQENLNSLGEQLAQEKLKNIQKDTTISQLGQEIAKLKLEVINMKGGN
jgi:hypothetical protein